MKTIISFLKFITKLNFCVNYFLNLQKNFCQWNVLIAKTETLVAVLRKKRPKKLFIGVCLVLKHLVLFAYVFFSTFVQAYVILWMLKTTFPFFFFFYTFWKFIDQQKVREKNIFALHLFEKKQSKAFWIFY